MSLQRFIQVCLLIRSIYGFPEFIPLSNYTGACAMYLRCSQLWRKRKATPTEHGMNSAKLSMQCLVVTDTLFLA